jgi:hypothetical protein
LDNTDPPTPPIPPPPLDPFELKPELEAGNAASKSNATNLSHLSKNCTKLPTLTLVKDKSTFLNPGHCLTSKGTIESVTGHPRRLNVSNICEWSDRDWRRTLDAEGEFWMQKS